MHALILGGARSGKSGYAERWTIEAAVARGASRRVYLATAQAFDAEMTERIARHQADRGPGWTTIEAPLAMPQALLEAASAPDCAVLVDCLTLWLSNLLLAERDPADDIETMMRVTAAARAPICFVSNEVGLGIVPENALARRFRDWQGRLNQRVAAEVETVVFMAAGLPMRLKPSGDARPGRADDE